MLKEIHLSHLPQQLAIFVALYKDVENASILRDQLLAGNAEFEYAFLDASMILSTSHVLASAFRAINDFMHNRLKSRNVHSETVFCLSPNNNIAESFRRFGVTETTKNLIALKIAVTPDITFDSVEAHLDSAVKGTSVEFNDENIKAVQDLAKIKKVYKLTNFGHENQKKGKTAPHGISSDTPEKDLEMAVIGSMTLRGAT